MIKPTDEISLWATVFEPKIDKSVEVVAPQEREWDEEHVQVVPQEPIKVHDVEKYSLSMAFTTTAGSGSAINLS